MKFIEFEQQFSQFIVISNQLLKYSFTNLNYILRLVSQWTKKGWLIKLRKGLYVINKSIYLDKLNKYYIANQIYTPSYISLESALMFYGFIPEHVYGITSITTKKTNSFNNNLGDFYYGKIKKTLFWGFKCIRIGESNVFFAEKEKSILDFLYLNIKNTNTSEDLIIRYRFQNLESLNKVKLHNYLKKFDNQKLKTIIINLYKNENNFKIKN